MGFIAGRRIFGAKAQIQKGSRSQFHGKALLKQRLVNIAAGADQHGIVRPGALALQNGSQRPRRRALHGQLAVQAADFDGLHDVFLGDGDNLIHILFDVGIEIWKPIWERRSKMPFLTVENLVVNYGAIKAVQGISLHVEEGEVITLLGANGAGKSSIINALVHLVEPAAGTITFRDTDITRLSTAAIVKIGVSQSMEGRQVFPRMSVLENPKMGGYTCGKEQIQEGIERAFSLFPILKERSGQPAGTFSGGEQQMLSLGRALMTNPKLLLLDEPSLGLAPLIVRQV